MCVVCSNPVVNACVEPTDKTDCFPPLFRVIATKIHKRHFVGGGVVVVVSSVSPKCFDRRAIRQTYDGHEGQCQRHLLLYDGFMLSFAAAVDNSRCHSQAE